MNRRTILKNASLATLGSAAIPFQTFSNSIFNENINKDEINQIIDVLKPLLSIETFTILQLIGFNFREAIGIPLTKLVNKSIDKEDKENINYQYAVSVNKKEEELFKLLQTEEGRAVYKELTKPQES